MSEILEPIETTESIEQPVENVIEETIESQVELQEQEQEVVKPYKERKIPESIPYSRFKEVTLKKAEAEERARAFEEQLQAKEAEIRKFLEKQENIKRYGSVDDIKANLDRMSPEEMVESLAAVMESKVSTQFEERRRAQEIETYNNKLATDFTSKITAAESSIPDIREMVDYVNHHAANIDPLIRTKLVTDEYSAELIAEIASTPEILNQLMHGPVYESLALLGELKADIKRAGKQSIQAKPDPVKVRVPNTPSGNVSNSNKTIPANVSMAEYKRLRSLGYT